MNAQMKAAWRKLVGASFLWAALAVLVYTPASGDDADRVIVTGLGFLSFAAGLAMFADGMERSIVERIRQGKDSNT